MEDNKNPLAAGFFFDRPREGAPDFVKGKLSIKVETALETLNKYKNDAGYVNLQLLNSKEGKLYLTVDTWQPTKKSEGIAYPEETINPADVPF